MSSQGATIRYRALVVATLIVASTQASAYNINNYWPDGDNIVMDDVLLPAATWSDPAQFQMSEWNELDTSNNSHPFRISNSPQFSFGSNDGDNTIGFLGESSLNSEYGLSYANALRLGSLLFELLERSLQRMRCHARPHPRLETSAPMTTTGFNQQSCMSLAMCAVLVTTTATCRFKIAARASICATKPYTCDDRVGVRQNATTVAERDITIYNKWHDGSAPQWMSMSATTLREW